MHLSLASLLLSLPPLAPQEATAAPARLDLLRLDVAESGLSASDLRRLGFDVAEHGDAGDAFHVIAGPADRARIEALSLPHELLTPDIEGHLARRLTAAHREAKKTVSTGRGAWLSPPFADGSMGGYYTLAEIGAVLDQIHAAYPTITTPKQVLGYSYEGRPIWALKVSDNPDVDEDEPEVRYDALHHAREPMSMQMLLYMLLALVEDYGVDPEVNTLVEEREVWFIPVVNPDGYRHNEVSNPAGGGLWRKNRRPNADGSIGVDLNRNYPYQWGIDDVGSSPTPAHNDYRGTAPASEPEVSVMLHFFEGREFRSTMSAHSYGDLWLHPWGHTSTPVENATQYFQTMQAHVDTGWIDSFEDGLYLGNGVTNDYDHAELGAFGWLCEIGEFGDFFWPPTNRIVPLCEEYASGFKRIAEIAGPFLDQDGPVQISQTTPDDFYDPGEVIGFGVAVKNGGPFVFEGPLTASFGPLPAGVTPVVATATVMSVPNGSSSDLVNHPISFKIDESVPHGTLLSFDLVWSGGAAIGVIPMELIVGRPIQLILDDVETDLGWELELGWWDYGSKGEWVREVPIGTVSAGQWANPPYDASPDPAAVCFVTGNGAATTSLDELNGAHTLRTPPMDLSWIDEPYLTVRYWLRYDGTGPLDGLELYVVDADGLWTTVEQLGADDAGEWIERTYRLTDYIVPHDQVEFRILASDDWPYSLFEAGIDDFRVSAFDSRPAFGGEPRLFLFGRAAPGADLLVGLSGPPGEAYEVWSGPDPADITLPGGETLYVDPSTASIIASGVFSADGSAEHRITLDSDPALSGTFQYFQAQVLTSPETVTNPGKVKFD
ncbi:MAG: M14 family metallopeptidase [Planctomycetota bacterium]